MKINLDGLEKIAELSPQKEYYDIFDRQTAMALIEVVKAAKKYLISRKVVDRELDWDAYERLEKALEPFE